MSMEEQAAQVISLCKLSNKLTPFFALLFVLAACYVLARRITAYVFFVTNKSDRKMKILIRDLESRDLACLMLLARAWRLSLESRLPCALIISMLVRR